MTEREIPEPLVPVYVCHNPAELPVAESLLTEAGIKFLVKGEPIQGMFGGGQVGGTNLLAPLGICVLYEDAAAALALLEGRAVPVEEPGV